MPEQIKSLIVILSFGTLGFLLARYVYKHQINFRVFKYWQIVWFAVISSACLVGNYWLFTFIVFGVGLYSVNRLKNNAVFLYLFLLPALPMLSNELPGFSGIRLIFEFNYPRMLAFSMLLPLALQNKRKIFPLLRQKTDKYFVIFISYNVLMGLTRSLSITDSFRSLGYILTDYFLPYFVISRLIDDFEKQKQALIAIASSAAILAAVNLIESLKHWFVYLSLYSSLHINYENFSPYAMVRSGSLRSTSAFSSPIVFGFFIVAALGAVFGLDRTKYSSCRLLLALLFSALLSTLSRGPWVGIVVLIAVLAWYSPKRSSNLVKLSAYSFIGMIFILLSPMSHKFISMLPFIGTVDTGNITYRQDLFNSSIKVIERNLFFGDHNFRDAPELQHLKQGQNIIDIVNTYLQVSLEYGLIGLFLFISFFLSHLVRLRKIFINKNVIKENSNRWIAIALFAIFLSMMIMIATVSKIDFIPIYYLIILALISAAISSARKVTMM